MVVFDYHILIIQIHLYLEIEILFILKIIMLI